VSARSFYGASNLYRPSGFSGPARGQSEASPVRIYRPTRGHRAAAAVVELAVVLPLLLLLLVGVWELGRIIQVQHHLNNATRDAARLAAQANTVSSSGAYTQIRFRTGTPNIESSIRSYLTASGVTDHANLVIELQFVEGPSPGSPGPSGTEADPYTGTKNQRFRVRVTLPYANVRWTTLSLINPQTLTAEAYWQCLVDDPFTLDTSLPGWSP
jgi:Flp pilus assembly protein TadG